MGSLLLAVVVILIALVVFPILSSMDKQVICNKIEVTINPKNALYFVEEQDVMEVLKEANEGQSLIGEKRSAINLNKLEEAVRSNPFLESAEVYQKMSGELVVNAKQKIPVYRVINRRGNSFYVAEGNGKIPFSTKYTPRVLVVSGFISESYEDSTMVRSKLLTNMSKVVQYIVHNSLWKAQIEQVYVDKSGLVYLIPKIGNHTIVLGSVKADLAAGLEEKFDKLLLFYKEGLGRKGWEEYSQIDLRYKKQVVAKKKETN